LWTKEDVNSFLKLLQNTITYGMKCPLLKLENYGIPNVSEKNFIPNHSLSDTLEERRNEISVDFDNVDKRSKIVKKHRGHIGVSVNDCEIQLPRSINTGVSLINSAAQIASGTTGDGLTSPGLYAMVEEGTGECCSRTNPS
jgi:hypothetical protein